MSDEIYLTPEELGQLRDAFHAQAKDMLAEFGDRALQLEETSEPNDVFRALDRVVHTIKGESSRRSPSSRIGSKTIFAGLEKSSVSSGSIGMRSTCSLRVVTC